MKNNSPLLISVTGWSGSGKTTFCEKLIRELSRRGYSIAAVKNTHRDLYSDKAGSDSNRYYEAGAESVCLNAGDCATIFRRKPLSSSKEFKELFQSSDFIIAEGFKSSDAVNIEVCGEIGDIAKMKNPPLSADLIVYADEELAHRLKSEAGSTPDGGFPPVIERNNIEAAADFLRDLLT